MWTAKLSNVVLDHGCKRYAVCGPYACVHTYVRTYARTHAQTKFSIEYTSVGHARPITQETGMACRGLWCVWMQGW